MSLEKQINAYTKNINKNFVLLLENEITILHKLNNKSIYYE